MRCHAEDIYLVESIDALKYWPPDKALSLNPANYPIWSGMSRRLNVNMRLC